MNQKLFRMFSIVCLGVLASCSSSSSGGGGGNGVQLAGLADCTAEAGSSVICGTVFAADGTTPVASATVSRIGANGNVAALKGLVTKGKSGLKAGVANSERCRTDAAGQFACIVDSGASGTLNFQISGSLFSTPLEFDADCTIGATTMVPTSETTATSAQTANVRWLVVQGAYDGIQLLLSQLKGCELTGAGSVQPPSLSASDECEDAGLTVMGDSVAEDFPDADLEDYQAIFFNCGSFLALDADQVTRVRNYVNDGGNVYFSDLEDEMLLEVFPDTMEVPDDNNDTSSGTLNDMTVADEGLQVFLGGADSPQTTIDIEFDLGVWAVIGSVPDSWTTYIEGDISDLGASYTGVRPITAGGPQGDGCVFYTSYHVEGSDNAGSPQETALKYLVLNRISNCE